MIYDVIGTILSLSSEKKKEKKDAPSMKEFALIDVREKERHQEEHPLYAVCVPYSVFESFVVGLVPSFTTDIVIMDDGDGEDALSVCCASILIQVNLFIYLFLFFSFFKRLFKKKQQNSHFQKKRWGTKMCQLWRGG